MNMHIQNNDTTPATPQNYIWHPIANKLYSLNCWYYSVLYKKSCSQFMMFVSFSIEKKYNPLLVWCPLCPTLTFCIHTKSNFYLANSLFAALSEPTLYRLLTFNVPHLMSLFRCLNHTKVSIKAWGKCSWFATKSVFKLSYQHLAQPQAGGPPLVGSPQLLSQYIRSCPPHWRPFIHPQPDDAPCHGDRDPLITGRWCSKYTSNFPTLG
jgi:hypothetical protein